MFEKYKEIKKKSLQLCRIENTANQLYAAKTIDEVNNIKETNKSLSIKDERIKEKFLAIKSKSEAKKIAKEIYKYTNKEKADIPLLYRGMSFRFFSRYLYLTIIECLLLIVMLIMITIINQIIFHLIVL